MESFCAQYAARVEHWRKEITGLSRDGRRAVVWGSGSKGVAFLSSLNLNGAIEYVVDINPFRQGRFMPGTGQEIVSPEFLANYRPDVAIAMNPIYESEIRQDLQQMGLPTTVVSV